MDKRCQSKAEQGKYPILKDKLLWQCILLRPFSIIHTKSRLMESWDDLDCAEARTEKFFFLFYSTLYCDQDNGHAYKHICTSSIKSQAGHIIIIQSTDYLAFDNIIQDPEVHSVYYYLKWSEHCTVSMVMFFNSLCAWTQQHLWLQYEDEIPHCE